MSGRLKFMRIIVMFDLPTLSANDKRQYRKFRKYLIKNGYIMMQESVYSRVVPSEKAVPGLLKHLKEHKPADGSVAALTITEQQYAGIDYICGDKFGGDYIDSTETVVFL